MEKQKSVQAVYRAGYTSYDGLDTYAAMPGRNVPIDALDPFLFLNHHGLQTYPPGNDGLPFGPHPHKGFETVTFIVEGDLVHKDSTGFHSNIRGGGIQWMTAGSGIIHSETSSDEFLANGGDIEILQLWINLAARHKNIPPHYIGLQRDAIPQVGEADGSVTVEVVSGAWGSQVAPIQSIGDVHLSLLKFKEGGALTVAVADDRTVLFYMIRGSVDVNGSDADIHDLVVFNYDGSEIHITAKEGALVLFGHGQPHKEPIAASGPFVMNTQEEIRQAFVDYQQGKFGVWKH